MKIPIQHSYKLIIEGKNIDLKFHLKSEPKPVEINLLFEPVTSFNRKKIVASINNSPSPLKATTRNILSQELNYLNYSPKNKKITVESEKLD